MLTFKVDQAHSLNAQTAQAKAFFLIYIFVFHHPMSRRLMISEKSLPQIMKLLTKKTPPRDQARPGLAWMAFEPLFNRQLKGYGPNFFF